MATVLLLDFKWTHVLHCRNRNCHHSMGKKPYSKIVKISNNSVTLVVVNWAISECVARGPFPPPFFRQLNKGSLFCNFALPYGRTLIQNEFLVSCLLYRQLFEFDQRFVMVWRIQFVQQLVRHPTAQSSNCLKVKNIYINHCTLEIFETE